MTQKYAVIFLPIYKINCVDFLSSLLSVHILVSSDDSPEVGTRIVIKKQETV